MRTQIMHQSGSEKTPCRVVLNSHLTTLTASTTPCTATSAYIHRKHGFLPSQNESSPTFLVRLFLSWLPSKRLLAQAIVGRVHAAVARQVVLVKVVFRNLVSFLDVKKLKLRETQKNAEKITDDTVVANDKPKAQETPESILPGGQR